METALSILKEKYKLTPVAPGRFGALRRDQGLWADEIFGGAIHHGGDRQPVDNADEDGSAADDHGYGGGDALCEKPPP
ncbi:MAG: hypothetical protein HDT26_12385 [Subdoligranulum sp.]|nr:hypothetical protein [Subdoligranulum sp.]